MDEIDGRYYTVKDPLREAQENWHRVNAKIRALVEEKRQEKDRDWQKFIASLWK